MNSAHSDKRKRFIKDVGKKDILDKKKKKALLSPPSLPNPKLFLSPSIAIQWHEQKNFSNVLAKFTVDQIFRLSNILENQNQTQNEPEDLGLGAGSLLL